MWRAVVPGDANSGTTTGPATPTGARWMWPATNVSPFLLRIWVLNSIVPLARTLIWVWPLAVDVEPVVSLLAVNFAWRTHMTPFPFFAGARLGVSRTAAQAARTRGSGRRIELHWPRRRLVVRQYIPGSLRFHTGSPQGTDECTPHV